MKERTLAAILVLLIISVISTGANTTDSHWWSSEWLMRSHYSHSFELRDTVSKYGRYADRTKTIAFNDLIKFHGLFCGGLVDSAGALKIAFRKLLPNGIIDRTDRRIASNNSACGCDVAAYLTGGRIRYGSHIIDQKLTESEFVMQQVSKGKIVRVRVKLEAYPTEVRMQMRKIEWGNNQPKDIDLLQELQWDYAKKIVARPLSETFEFVDATDYKWPEPSCRELGNPRDNSYKEELK